MTSTSASPNGIELVEDAREAVVLIESDRLSFLSADKGPSDDEPGIGAGEDTV
jgi:hypothetical protein